MIGNPRRHQRKVEGRYHQRTIEGRYHQRTVEGRYHQRKVEGRYRQQKVKKCMPRPRSASKTPKKAALRSASVSSSNTASSTSSFLKLYHVLIIYVVVTFSAAIYYHRQKYNSINYYYAALAFFLPLNTLIGVWEISLGLNINHIHLEYQAFNKKYGNNKFDSVIDFFNYSVSIYELISLKFWSRVWSTYSLYDPSYCNKESFGFFVDVGNGWTTTIPSMLFLYCMTYDVTFVTAQTLGLIGLLKFYQELYGTCIYFLSFILNERYKNKSIAEIVLFVALTNGLWFVFPIIGMIVSYHFIISGDYSFVRS